MPCVIQLQVLLFYLGRQTSGHAFFNPDSDIIDTLLLSFEPKLKAVNSTMLMEEVDAVVAKD